MFEGWDEYYLLIGSAAGALIGLLFVVVTLTQNLDRSYAQKGADLFMTPTVFHFAVVVLLSGVALAPKLSPLMAGWAVGLAAVAGSVNAAVVAVRIRLGHAPEPSHWSDVWCYGAAPAALYLGLLWSGFALSDRAALAPLAVAALLMALLLVCIRNAWDLVTFLAPRSGDKPG